MRWHHRYHHPADWLRRLALSVGTVAFALTGFASVSRAAVYTFSDTIPVTLAGPRITVEILAGSLADSVDIQANTLTVQVAAAESFTLRYPNPAGTLTNNGGLSACNPGGSGNDVTVTGPATVIFTPDAATPCTAPAGGGGGGGGNVAPSVTLAQPNGGATYDAGTALNVFWSASGTQVTGIRLSLSTDSGVTFPTILSAGEANDGHYSWAVPSTATTTARLKAEALISGGSVGASDASDADFAIRVLPNTVEPAPTIDADKELEPPAEPPAQPAQCLAGTLIKGTLAAVYYCGKDGRRYVFPNQDTYFSWYKDFSSVVTITPEALASLPLGGNVTYKPGSLVKIQTDPKVYVVSKGGLLRWVQTESAAIALFGTNWSKLVHDVPDAFFLNYVIGPPLL